MENNKILELNKKIEETKSILKSEFFGIDDQIDDILNNMKPWLFFPEIQMRPMIINLWGMSGVGKTSVVNRIIELLDLKKFSTYFNFAAISEQSNWEIEDNLDENVSQMDINTPIFIYDEFQHARTMNEKGEEINKPALKIFWELLDSGKYSSRWNYSTKLSIKRMYKAMKEITKLPEVVIKDGNFVNGETHYKRFTRENQSTSKGWQGIDDKLEQKEKPTLFTTEQKNHIFEVLNRYYPDKYLTEDTIYDEVGKMNKEELYKYIENVHSLMLQDISIDFSKALIFVIGNLDEAYQMTYDLDPDMSSDQFHERSKKISIVTIKEALQKRFRNEQVARLGNIHLIYPAFSSETFKKIIDKNIYDYIDQVEDLCGFLLCVHGSVRNIIYKDSVFPTQGTRPIFTSIHEIIKTKLPQTLLYAIENKVIYDTVIYSYKDNKIIVEYYKHGDEQASFEIEQKLRTEDLRKSKQNDQQVLTAVHEAGHAIVSIRLMQSYPEKVVSSSTTSDKYGFMDPDYEEDKVNNLEDLRNNIAICLAGKAAETFIFGEDRTSNGCSEDYSNATRLASYWIRKCGFGKKIAVNGWMEQNPFTDTKIYDKENDSLIEELLRQCNEMANSIIHDEYKLFLMLSRYLSNNTSINKEGIEELVKKYGKYQVYPKDENIYRNILEEKIKLYNN